MKISELELGYRFKSHKYGEGVIIALTKRTVTAVFRNMKSKITYRSADEHFSPSDF